MFDSMQFKQYVTTTQTSSLVSSGIL